jgi:GNAT superfamily N-acetyltransferase
MRGEEIDGPGANYMIAAVDRFVTVKTYRGKGFGKSILAHCMTDILQFILEMGINVQRISMFIPIHPECVNAAHVANASGLHAVGEPRAEDPTHTAMPSFASEGVQEFAITSEALLAAYHSAVEGSGGESYAAAGV